MQEVSINGKWIGSLTYDQRYPKEYRDRITQFSIHIECKDGYLKGSCEDDITNTLKLEAASIEGTFKYGTIRFIKRYSCMVVTENNEMKADLTKSSADIQYSGILCKKIFSGKYYFRGTWDISGSVVDEKGETRHYTIGGKWKMEREPS